MLVKVLEVMDWCRDSTNDGVERLDEVFDGSSETSSYSMPSTWMLHLQSCEGSNGDGRGEGLEGKSRKADGVQGLVALRPGGVKVRLGSVIESHGSCPQVFAILNPCM